MKDKLNAGSEEGKNIIRNDTEVLKRYEIEINELKKKLALYVCFYSFFMVH